MTSIKILFLYKLGNYTVQLISQAIRQLDKSGNHTIRQTIRIIQCNQYLRQSYSTINKSGMPRQACLGSWTNQENSLSWFPRSRSVALVLKRIEDFINIMITRYDYIVYINIKELYVKMNKK